MQESLSPSYCIVRGKLIINKLKSTSVISVQTAAKPNVAERLSKITNAKSIEKI